MLCRQADKNSGERKIKQICVCRLGGFAVVFAQYKKIQIVYYAVFVQVGVWVPDGGLMFWGSNAGEQCNPFETLFNLRVDLGLVVTMKFNDVGEFLESQRYVRLAYLFGSYAQGKEGPLSDVDVAVLVDQRLSESSRFDLRLKLIKRISEILRVKESGRLDVVVMNDAPLSLNYEIIKEGRVLFAKDVEERVEMESKILSKYLDRRYYERRGLAEFLNKIERKGRL